MAEIVVTLDIDVEWEPNAPEAVLAANDTGETALAMKPHPDDVDQSAVVLTWSSSRYTLMGDPNDESLEGHRLFGKGLENLLWVGRVSNSRLITTLEKQNRVHARNDPAQFADLSHYVVRTKEQVVEVVARGFTVKRVPGSPRTAAIEALQH